MRLLLYYKECTLAVHRTIVAQTHATWFWLCCIPLQKAQMYGTEIGLSWADHWLVRSRSANLRFLSCLHIFGLRLYYGILLWCTQWMVIYKCHAYCSICWRYSN